MEYPSSPSELQESIDLADQKAGASLKLQGIAPLKSFDSREDAPSTPQQII